MCDMIFGIEAEREMQKTKNYSCFKFCCWFLLICQFLIFFSRSKLLSTVFLITYINILNGWINFFGIEKFKKQHRNFN